MKRRKQSRDVVRNRNNVRLPALIGTLLTVTGFAMWTGKNYAEPLPQLFEDKTAQSGIHFVTNNASSSEKHLIETMAGGVTIFDFDNDGLPDIYFLNGAAQPSLQKAGPQFSNRLFRNLGNWKFADVTERSGLTGKGFDMAAAPGDYDNDGQTDLFLASVNGGSLYRNSGNGSFEDVTVQAGIKSEGWSVGAAWFDYDADGFLDLFVVRYVKWDPAREPWCGEQSPKVRTYCDPRFYEPISNQLFHNNGDGTFTDVSRESGIGAYAGKGMSVAVGDYDNDQRLDLFVANDGVPNFLFHNEGDGHFREVGLRSGTAYNDDGSAISSMGSAFGDLDNDGREDLVVTGLANETFPLFRNVGDGTFIDASYSTGLALAARHFSGWGLGLRDLNNDGWKDLLIAGGDVQDNTERFSSRKSKQQNLLLWNIAGRAFRAQALNVPGIHRGLAFGDFDRDGRLDVVVTRLNDTPLILHNVDASGNHWIGLQLKGHKSNSGGIGARITVQSGDLVQVGRSMPVNGYASSSELNLHFGLGARTVVDRITIEWPSGVRQVVSSPMVDQQVKIKEP